VPTRPFQLNSITLWLLDGWQTHLRKANPFAIGVAPERVAIKPPAVSRTKLELAVAASASKHQPTTLLSSVRSPFVDAEGQKHVVLKMQLKSLQVSD
jgi:hypothetical protein